MDDAHRSAARGHGRQYRGQIIATVIAAVVLVLGLSVSALASDGGNGGNSTGIDFGGGNTNTNDQKNYGEATVDQDVTFITDDDHLKASSTLTNSSTQGQGNTNGQGQGANGNEMNGGDGGNANLGSGGNGGDGGGANFGGGNGNGNSQDTNREADIEQGIYFDPENPPEEFTFERENIGQQESLNDNQQGQDANGNEMTGGDGGDGYLDPDALIDTIITIITSLLTTG